MFAFKSRRFGTAGRAILLVVMLALTVLASTAVAGGNTWSAVPSGATVHLRSVQFPTISSGLIAGDSGTILKTTDGGGTWTPQTSGTALDLYGLSMVDSQTGWAVGDQGAAIKTNNGGSTWTAMSSGTSNRLLSVVFDQSNNGYAVGYNGTTLKSSDGGATWRTLPPVTNQHLTSVSLDRGGGVRAVGTNGTILLSSLQLDEIPGQFVWTARSSGVTDTLLSVDWDRDDFGNMWAVGAGGVILHSADNGGTWTPQASGTTANLWSVTAPDRFNVWVVGDGVILNTANGGATWVLQRSPIDVSLLSVRFPDSQTGSQFADSREGWAAGANGVLLRSGQSKTYLPLLTKNHAGAW